MKLMNYKFYVGLFCLLSTTIGILGPAAFIDSQGNLNLFEISKAAKLSGLPNSEMYAWIGMAFVVFNCFILLFFLFRTYKLAAITAMLAIIVWSVSVFMFYQWHGTEMANIKEVGASLQFDFVVYTIFIKNLKLQWGVYLILVGMSFSFLWALMCNKLAAKQ